LEVLPVEFSAREMMPRVGATLAADYSLPVEMFGQSPLVLAVMPLLALQVAEYFAA
jgi:hypothetical protein